MKLVAIVPQDAVDRRTLDRAKTRYHSFGWSPRTPQMARWVIDLPDFKGGMYLTDASLGIGFDNVHLQTAELGGASSDKVRVVCAANGAAITPYWFGNPRIPWSAEFHQARFQYRGALATVTFKVGAHHPVAIFLHSIERNGDLVELQHIALWHGDFDTELLGSHAVFTAARAALQQKLQCQECRDSHYHRRRNGHH